MKQLKGIFRITSAAFIILIMCSIAAPASAQEKQGQDCPDSVMLSLLTCSPNQKAIYSLYGHTAIRFRDLRTGEDWVFNYGVFSFKKPFFALRFALGFTDYELGVLPYSIFRSEYAGKGVGVVEQPLNITPEEKIRIINALDDNYRPENRVYRYNFFYNNCTTKARDIIEECLNGEVTYGPDQPEAGAKTYREIIHSYTKGHPWATFGEDLCLGLKADLSTTQRERQFIPGNLKNDFDEAVIVSPDGGTRKLTCTARTLVAPRKQAVEREFPFSPTQCACVLLLIAAVTAAAEYRKRKTCRAWDVLLMLITGIVGIVVTVVFFSKHPTTSTNLQVLLLNPLPLFFIPSVIRRKATIYWKISAILLILFLIGGLLQDYAEGMEIVALCLLTRCWIHLRLDAKQKM